MNIPTPDTLRATLKRRSAKHGNAALARSIGIAPDKLWNFASGRTYELKHRDLVAVLRHLNINTEPTEP